MSPRGRGAAVFAGWLALGIASTRSLWPGWRGAIAAMGAALPGALPGSSVVLAHAAAGHVLALAGLAAMAASMGAAGGPLARLVRLRGDTLDRAGWRWFLGAGLLSLLCLALGLDGLLRPPVLAAIAIGFVIGGLPGLRRFRPKIEAASRLPVAWLVLVLAAYFLLARLPGTLQDPMAYDFAAPEEYLRAGRLHAEIAHIQWTEPLGYAMLVLVPWWLGGIAGAKLVNLVLVLAGCIAVRGLARSLRGPGGWAALAFATAGVVGSLVWQGKNDLAGAVFAAGAGWGVLLGLGGSAGGWIAGGWCAGAAVGCKLTAGLAVVPLAAAALAVGRPRSPRGVALGALAGLAAFGPWTMRAWLETGNPCTPFATGLFPDIGWSPELQHALRTVAMRISGSGPFRPSEIFMGAWRVLGDPAVGSIAIIVLVPLGWITTRCTGARALKLATIGAYAAWLPTERNPRFLLPLIPWLAAMAVSRAPGPRPRVGRVAASATAPLVAAAALAALGLAFQAAAPDGPAVWLGTAGRDDVWRRQFTTLETARRWVAASLPRDARVLLTGGDRRLGFGRRVFSTAQVFSPPFRDLTRDSFTPAEIRKRLRQRGATHWLHSFVEAEFRGMGWYVQPAWDDRQIRLGLVFFRRYARPIRSPETVDHEGGGYWAFEFTDAPGDFQVLFLPGTEARLKPAFDRLIAGDARAAYAIAQRLAGPCAATLEVQAQLGYLALEAGDAAAALRWLAPGVRAGYVGDGSLAHVAAAELQLGHTEAAAGAAARAARVYGPHAP